MFQQDTDATLSSSSLKISVAGRLVHYSHCFDITFSVAPPDNEDVTQWNGWNVINVEIAQDRLMFKRLPILKNSNHKKNFFVKIIRIFSREFGGDFF